MAISMVEVRGHYEDAHRTLRTGSVTLTPSFPTSNGTTTITGIPVTTDLVNGNLSVTVAAGNDTGTTPTGMVYQVAEILDVPNKPPLVTTYNITVSAADAAAGIDLATAPRAVVSQPTYAAYLTQITGDARYLQLAGGTLTGALTLPALRMTTGPAIGKVLTSDGTGNAAWQAPGAVSGTDWINVKTYGATGDGTTDDTAAIQAALNACPPGGITYMPAAVYRTSAPLNIPPYVTLQGAHGGGEAQSAGWSPPCSIKPLATFSGVAALQILDQQLGSYSRLASEIAIRNLTVDGSAVPAGTAVDGIRATGQIQGLLLRDVQVRSMTGNGITTAYNTSAPPGPQAPFCLHFERVSVLWSKSYGVTLNNSTDSYFSDVYVLGCSGSGWYISGADNSTWHGCRAEWSGSDGFKLAGGKGNQTFIGCSTDRSANNGFSVLSSTDTGTIMLIGCRATRDGKSSTTLGYAGLRVDSTTRKVLADSLMTKPGADDDATGNVSPQYGVSVNGSAYVTVDSGDLTAVSSGWFDGGGNTTFLHGPLVTGTGISSWNWPGTASTTAASATALILQALVSGDTQPRFTIDGSGKIRLGPGGATAPTTNLYYNGGNLQTDSYFVMNGGQSGGGFAAYLASAKALTAGSVGGGLAIKEGTNGRMGTLTLTGATPVVVSNTSVTAISRIFLTTNVPGGTPGFCWVSARTAGTSFSVTGTAGDTSTVAWMIVEPA